MDPRFLWFGVSGAGDTFSSSVLHESEVEVCAFQALCVERYIPACASYEEARCMVNGCMRNTSGMSLPNLDV
jgi:hypothetical protein